MAIDINEQREIALKEIEIDRAKIESAKAQIAAAEVRIASNKSFLDALYVVEKRVAAQGFDAPSGTLPGMEATDAPIPSFAECVRRAVSTFNEEQFTVADVENVLRRMNVPLPQKNLRTRITVEVIPMHKTGQIEITHRGTGKIPNRYRIARRPTAQ